MLILSPQRESILLLVKKDWLTRRSPSGTRRRSRSPLKMEQELTALESIITQQEEPVPSIVEEELRAVESILCREGEFIRLSETCIRLELEAGTWLTLGNALDVFLGV